jgi:DNA ligase (NAD+)
LNILKNTLGRPYIGQKVQVAKMNMIIPQILSAEEWQEGAIEIIPPSICPVCGQPVKIITSDSGVETLMCNNDQCQGQLINVLEHYYGKKGLDIKGLSKATLEKLIDLNWLNSPEDIFSLYLHRDSWIKQPGFGEKSVDKILNTISDVAEGIDLWRVISAAGIPLIGSTIAKQLANYFKTYKAFREAVDNKFDFSCLEGFGPNMTDSVLNFDYTVLDKIAYYLTIKEPKEQDTTSLEGLKFAITGKLHMFKNRSELKTIVENSGGKVVDSVSKNTSYLINNDTESNSSKNKAAKSLNIPIITEEKFIEIFLTK